MKSIKTINPDYNLEVDEYGRLSIDKKQLGSGISSYLYKLLAEHHSPFRHLEKVLKKRTVSIYETSTPGVWGVLISKPTWWGWPKSYIGFNSNLEEAASIALDKYYKDHPEELT